MPIPSSFDDISFPLPLAASSVLGVRFRTAVVTTDGGFERRNTSWAQARRIYDAASGVRSAVELSVLRAFFMARQGRARAFRVKDPLDYTSALNGTDVPQFHDQELGIGDGTRTRFTLEKTYGTTDISHNRRIQKPVVGSLSVGVNGAVMANGWNLDSNDGSIVFNVPPANGAVVTAGFAFDVPVRFDSDTLDVTLESLKRASSSIPMIEVRL